MESKGRRRERDAEDGDRRRGREEETGAAEFRREKKGEKEAPPFLLQADFPQSAF